MPKPKKSIRQFQPRKQMSLIRLHQFPRWKNEGNTDQTGKERLLEQFEKSGKTHAQFAEENGLNVKTLSKWIYEWHHQIKTTNEVKFVEIKTTAISSVNDIRIKKSGMEILIPAELEQYQLKNILTVLASI